MNIVVPIDFSANSRTAAYLAASLVAPINGSVHLVHANPPYEEESAYITVKTMQVRRNTVFEMFTLQEELRQKFAIQTSCDIEFGEVVRSTSRAGKRQNSALIIAGTQGDSGLKKYLFGSNACAFIAEHALPLMLVPEKTSTENLKHVILWGSSTEDAKRQLASVRAIGLQGLTTITLFSPEKSVEDSALRIGALSVEIRTIQRCGDPSFFLRDTAEYIRGLPEPAMLVLTKKHDGAIQVITGRHNYSETFDVEVPLLILPS